LESDLPAAKTPDQLGWLSVGKRGLKLKLKERHSNKDSWQILCERLS